MKKIIDRCIPVEVHLPLSTMKEISEMVDEDYTQSDLFRHLMPEMLKIPIFHYPYYLSYYERVTRNQEVCEQKIHYPPQTYNKLKERLVESGISVEKITEAFVCLLVKHFRETLREEKDVRDNGED